MDVKIAVLIMVKNEAKCITKTLESVKHLDGVILYDTGSTDDTVEVVKRVCKEYSLPVFVKYGIFKDFATSRNILHEFADSMDHDYTHYLLLDANDELVGDLKKFIQTRPDASAYMVLQKWKTSSVNTTKYYNIRVVAARAGAKYHGAVHEYLEVVGTRERLPEDVNIFQDRIGVTSSADRWEKDRVLLEAADKTPRTLFYLAQTYACLGDHDKAFETYKRRAETRAGFYEERFAAMVKCAEYSKSWLDKYKWAIKAFKCINRVEPILIIANWYMATKQYKLAYCYAKLACELSYPTECNLFVDSWAYEYKRWHVLSIVAYYTGHLEEGHSACKKAIDVAGAQVDRNNLRFYEK